MYLCSLYTFFGVPKPSSPGLPQGSSSMRIQHAQIYSEAVAKHPKTQLATATLSHVCVCVMCSNQH